MTSRAISTGDRGFALIAVLLIATILAGISVGLMVLARQAAEESEDITANIENRAAGQGGLNRMILAYAEPGDPFRERLVGDGRAVAWDFAGKNIILCVQAESGKVDLNAGNRDHIAALIRRLVAEQEVQGRFLARLDEARVRQQLITSVSALLPPFDRMTTRRDLIEAHFTTLTGQRGFDPRTAPQAVIETAPGLPDMAREEILSARAAGRMLDPRNVAFAPAQMFMAEKPVYTLRAEASTRSGRLSAMTTQVEFFGQGRLSIFSWRAAAPHGCR